MGTIFNGNQIPLDQLGGTVPNMMGALQGWLQNIVFTVVSKSTVAFQLVEVGSPINFTGVVQPLSGRQLQIKPEGERAWNWFQVHSLQALPLSVDDVINYLGTQYRVMSQKDYSLYGYFYYEIVEDWTGAGP